MTRWLFMLLTCVVVGASDYVLPSFPEVSDQRGAEGWGMATTGGRGGAVLKVTNTNSSGAGSFYDAMKQTYPRVIIICVDGWITTDRIQLTEPHSDFTLVGHLAPGKGAGVRLATGQGGGGGMIYLGQNTSGTRPATNFVIRYMRFRMGAAGIDTVDDTLALGGLLTGNIPVGCTNAVVANSSISWGHDEVFSLRFGRAATVQDCIISEAIRTTATTTANRFGGIMDGNTTIVRNLFQHCWARTPRQSWDGTDIRNNVLFNTGDAKIMLAWPWTGGPTPHDGNIVANYLKPGPASLAYGNAGWEFDMIYYDITNPDSSAYVTGNYIEGDAAATANNWLTARIQDPIFQVEGDRFEASENTKAFITTLTALQAVEHVTNYAGAILPQRDDVDTRLIAEFNGQAVDGDTLNGLLQSETQVGGWPNLGGGTTPYVDSDNDGMADSWELANFLTLGRNGQGYYKNQPGFGYTDLECYLYNIDPADTNSWRRDLYTGVWERDDPSDDGPDPDEPPVTGAISLNGTNQLTGRVRLLRQ